VEVISDHTHTKREFFLSFFAIRRTLTEQCHSLECQKIPVKKIRIQYKRKDFRLLTAESTKKIVDELILLCSGYCLENSSIDVFFSND